MIPGRNRSFHVQSRLIVFSGEPREDVPVPHHRSSNNNGPYRWIGTRVEFLSIAGRGLTEVKPLKVVRHQRSESRLVTTRRTTPHKEPREPRHKRPQKPFDPPRTVVCRYLAAAPTHLWLGPQFVHRPPLVLRNRVGDQIREDPVIEDAAVTVGCLQNICWTLRKCSDESVVPAGVTCKIVSRQA